MIYNELLDLQPPSTAAGDKAAAGRFVQALTNFIEGGSARHLPVAQQNYLYKLRQKWTIRAQGNDRSWNEYGNKPGRRKKPELARPEVDKTAFGSEDEMDPLLASLLRKYGTPQRTDDI